MRPKQYQAGALALGMDYRLGGLYAIALGRVVLGQYHAVARRRVAAYGHGLAF